tara:strand:+ start:3813 stop:4142 length:330 start_codon:yes stop_codon:yes gene_type:complete
LRENVDKFYEVLEIKAREPGKFNAKSTLNSINHAVKNLIVVFPHLHYYGDETMFTLRSLCAVPEILLSIDSEYYKVAFQNAASAPRKSKKILGHVEKIERNNEDEIIDI